MATDLFGGTIRLKDGWDLVHFRLLGELELESGGRVIRLRGPRLRSLLAYLLVNRNRTVPRDHLIDALWGARPSPRGSHRLEELVSRLRGVVGREAGSRIETTPGGYRLHVAPQELDIDRFERLVATGRRALAAGDADTAIEHFRKGLDEWNGPAFGELVYEPFVVQEAARLEELRLDALEAMFEAELRSGGHEDVVSELEAFVATHPLREHARAQLMRALYAYGRQADALDAYRAGYRLLTEQGLEPEAELRHVQASILQLEPNDREPADLPVTRYVHNRDVAIAYQVLGEGPYDVVYMAPFVTNVELAWQVPGLAEFLRRLGSFGRLVRFDKRGTGMSDRVDPGELETGVDDVQTVMDAAVSTRAAIIGALEGGPLAILFAARHPERVWALVLWGTTARVAWATDYPFGVPRSELEPHVTEDERIWTEPGYAEARARAIGAANVPELASLWRQSATPGTVRALAQHYFEVDVRDVLRRIRVPTLVLCRAEEDSVAAQCRYLAEHIAGARCVFVPGSDRVMWGAGDSEPIVREIRGFLDEAWKQHLTAPQNRRPRSLSPGAL
jgi:DNA-binding SARP family transcriptional activator/pimeloyl-ACP methyl ester carboxylesterase